MKNRNFTEQLKRVIAKVKFKESGSFVVISAGDLIYDILRVDPKVIKGVDFLRSDDLSNVFSFAKKELQEREIKSPESLEGLHDNYTGYTFERVVALDYRTRGAEVSFPENPNQPGYDLIINGQAFQVKTQKEGINLLQEHFEKYPVIPVIANKEAAEKFIEKYPERSHLVVNSGFSHDEASNLVKESTDAAVEIYEDDNLFGSAIPEILGIVSIISIGKNFMYWAEGKTDAKTAMKNIAIDSVGRFAGAGIGAKIGSFFFPPFGTLIGGVGGLIFGGSIVNSIKIDECKKEIKAVEKDLDNYIRKCSKIMKKNEKTFNRKTKYLDKRLKKMSDIMANVVGKDDYNSAKQFYDFVQEKIENEEKKKKTVLKKFESIINQKKSTVNKFVKLNKKKFEDKDGDRYLNVYASEAMTLASSVGVNPEFLPFEASKLFNSVKKFVKAVEKRGV